MANWLALFRMNVQWILYDLLRINIKIVIWLIDQFKLLIEMVLSIIRKLAIDRYNWIYAKFMLKSNFVCREI